MLNLAEISFVGFYDFSLATEWCKTPLPHCFADAMTKKPCRLVSDFERAMHLVRAHAFFGRTEQCERLCPQPQWDMAGFQNALGPNRKTLAAFLFGTTVQA